MTIFKKLLNCVGSFCNVKKRATKPANYFAKKKKGGAYIDFL